jgi:2-alkenal reductase
MRVFVILVISLFVLTSCGQDATPQGIVSTPIEALPIQNISQQSGIPPTPVSIEIVEEADAEYLLLTNIYERTTPSIVNIESEISNGDGLTPNLTRGSGFIYDSDGHIITNAHVTKGARTIRVTFNDGYVTNARLVGLDTFSDLAVLKVDTIPDRLIPLILGNSNTVKVGQRAIAIGNPFGLNSSMTVGIVSGVGRTLRSAELIDASVMPGFDNPSIIQTDTPINPGNSGGPLLNSYGVVIGVTTAIRSDSGIFQGVGFAVPADTVRRVVPAIIETGRVDYPWMGISVMPEDNGFGVAGLAEPLGLPVNRGVLLRGVTQGSPADLAGLRGGQSIMEVRGTLVCSGGDIIIAVNDYYIATMDDLVSYLILNARPSDTVNLLVIRGNDTFEVPMTLQSRPTTNDATTIDCSTGQ